MSDFHDRARATMRWELVNSRAFRITPPLERLRYQYDKLLEAEKPYKEHVKSFIKARIKYNEYE
jgi:hypothetical protein